VREDGSFKPADELWPIYVQAIAEASEVVVCRLTGACSAHTWFVLKELLGVRRVRSYDNA
jgi:thiosulfate/3-mercaptopyruvate sulfurtransferase